MKIYFFALTTSVFAIVLTLTAIPAFSQSRSIVGTWRLIAADKILLDGSQVPDYGSDPHGIAIFTVDGHYVVEIFRSNRMKFASGDRAAGTAEEYKDAIMTASCHYGTYAVDWTKGRITFHTDRASFPNWDETTRVSDIKLEGDKLTWRVPPRPDGTIPISVFSKVQ